MTSLLPEPPQDHRGPYIHFRRRVAERIGQDVDALNLWWQIVTSVARGGSTTVVFIGRLNRRGRRIWRVTLPDGRAMPVVFDHDLGCPITVLTWDAGEIRCGAKRQKILSRAGVTKAWDAK